MSICGLVALGVVAPPTHANSLSTTELTMDQFSIWSVVASSNDTITLNPYDSVSQTDSEAKGTLAYVSNNHWTWTAPNKPGVYELLLSKGKKTQRLKIFVLTPWNPATGKIGSYEIGQYESGSVRGPASHHIPKGFIKLNSATRDIRISERFTLNNFRSKQRAAGSDDYVLFTTPLLLKLEMLAEELEKICGGPVNLQVMSGFRSPSYNREIGNRTTRSRHLYGDAADVFVDNNHDGYMDDLTGDAKVDVADAHALAAVAERLRRENPKRWQSGGLAVYKKKSRRGPFIHIDGRGTMARWGHQSGKSEQYPNAYIAPNSCLRTASSDKT